MRRQYGDELQIWKRAKTQKQKLGLLKSACKSWIMQRVQTDVNEYDRSTISEYARITRKPAHAVIEGFTKTLQNTISELQIAKAFVTQLGLNRKYTQMLDAKTQAAAIELTKLRRI